MLPTGVDFVFIRWDGAFVVGREEGGAAMHWRWISAVTSAGTSFGLIAFCAYAVLAANAIEPKKFTSAPSLISERNATGADTTSAGLQPDAAFESRAVRMSNVIVTSDDPRLAEPAGLDPPQLISEAPSHEANAEDATSQLAATYESKTVLRGKAPAVPGDRPGVSKVRYAGAQPPWDIAKARSPERGGQQIATRRGLGEGRVTAKIALVLGVGF